MNARAKRTRAEWVALIGSTALLLVVVALIALQIPDDDQPAMPVARIEKVRSVEEAFHVDVIVENTGDRTAENVQVSAELTIGDEVQTGEQVIDFLSHGEEVEVTFVFSHDPTLGELTASVASFTTP